MSLARMGNATAVVLASDGIKALLTSNENKPATKGDLKKLFPIQYGGSIKLWTILYLYGLNIMTVATSVCGKHQEWRNIFR